MIDISKTGKRAISRLINTDSALTAAIGACGVNASQNAADLAPVIAYVRSAYIVAPEQIDAFVKEQISYMCDMDWKGQFVDYNNTPIPHGQLPANNHEIAEKLTGNELTAYINSLSREDLIKWLSWNDPNGIYSDADSMQEFGAVMTIEQGREIMIRQISDNQ